MGRFLLGDARKLAALPGLRAGSFDGVTFLLSLQDMDPLGPVLAAAAWALRPGGRVAILLTHPAFRVPRQSGWGWDEGRRLQYRRVDRYLTPLPVPMQPLEGRPDAATRSFHRPLSAYVNALADAGLLVERMVELPGHKAVAPADRAPAADRARQEIPLFLALRAREGLSVCSAHSGPHAAKCIVRRAARDFTPRSPRAIHSPGAADAAAPTGPPCHKEKHKTSKTLRVLDVLCCFPDSRYSDARQGENE